MHRDKTGRPAVDVLEARRLLAWGEADQGFGDDGVVLLDENVVDAVHLTPNGVIASGAWGSRPRVVALDTAGEIDTDFGNAGTATGDVRPARLGRFQQDDGKIIVAGFAVDSYDEMLLRLNADGTVDRSFGDNGLAASGFREGSVFSFAQQPDGKLLIAGLYREDAGSGDTHAIVRMLPDGSLDPTFGDNGLADQLNTLATGFLSSAPSILRLEDMNIGVMPDGRITVSANMIAGLLGSRVPILFRLNADGSTDTSLDFYGARIFNPHQGRETIQTLAVDSAGRLLLGGTYESRFAVWRLDASLRPDRSFSGDGRLDRFGDYYSSVNAVRELDGGDIVVAGYGTLGGVVGKALLATAVTSDGGYVEAFGGGSDTIFDAGLGLSSSNAEIDADGRIAMEVFHSDSARWGVALFEGRTPSTPPQPPTQPPTPPPTADTLDLTALTPTSSVNGWGPYELNQSNGEKPAGDGRTLTIQGQTFAKGFGVHANSRLTFDVPAGYQRFTAFAGVDDEVGSRG
ncbi:MAG: NPCBM/NEW2 domain-containing protein, partial [Planctomycetota bacterium]